MMKQSLFLCLLKWLRFFCRILPLKKNIYLVLPTGYGSIGDDAMVRVVVDYFTSQGQSVRLLTGQTTDGWEESFFRELVSVDAISTDKFITKHMNALRFIITGQRCWIIGADIMDGAYDVSSTLKRLDCAFVASNLGMETRILGFSFNHDPNIEIVKHFQKLNKVSFFLRDERSAERFEKYTGATNYTICADLAFLSRPVGSLSASMEKCLAWVINEHSKGCQILGININDYPFRIGKKKVPQDPERILDRTVDLVKSLIEGNDVSISVVAIPHDFRHSHKLGSDIAMAERLTKRLNEEKGISCFCLLEPFNSNDITALTANLDFILTARMHLAVLGLVNNVPSLAIGYQDKFEGMYSHFGLDHGMVINSEDFFDEKSLLALQESFFNRSNLRKTITSALQTVCSLSKKNLLGVSQFPD